MNRALGNLRLIRIVMLLAIVVYAFLGEWLAHSLISQNKVVFYACTALGVVMVFVILLLPRFTIYPAARILASDPDNSAALQRWQTGYLTTFALCEAIGLYGLLLRFLGFKSSRAAPFYVVALALLFYFAPRIPADTVG